MVLRVTFNSHKISDEKSKWGWYEGCPKIYIHLLNPENDRTA